MFGNALVTTKRERECVCVGWEKKMWLHMTFLEVKLKIPMETHWEKRKFSGEK